MFCNVFHIKYIYYIIRNETKNRLLGESVEKTSQSLLEEVVAVRLEEEEGDLYVGLDQILIRIV